LVEVEVVRLALQDARMEGVEGVEIAADVGSVVSK